jgi:hypothetical protein
VPGKDFTTLWWSFAGAAKQNKIRPGPEKKTGNNEMTFTGNLIEHLMATVERAEQRTQADRGWVVEPMADEPWFASVQENADYDSQLLGVA